MLYYVYEHWRPDRNECFYVGKGAGNRAYDLWGRNHHHRSAQKDLRNSGHKGVQVQIVFVTNVESIAYEIEIEKIKTWRDSGNPLLANLRKGGGCNSGWKHSESTKKRMSESRIGKLRPEISGNNHPFYGKRFGVHLLSKEERAKSRHIFTDADKEKRRESSRKGNNHGKRWKLSPEALANNILGRKKAWVTRRANESRA